MSSSRNAEREKERLCWAKIINTLLISNVSNVIAKDVHIALQLLQFTDGATVTGHSVTVKSVRVQVKRARN